MTLKEQAHAAVREAILDGVLPPPWTQACDQRCGRAATEYHHDCGFGESAWLKVLPLCAKCHEAEDKLLIKLAQNLARGLGFNRSGPTEQSASVGGE